jgi:hypothetical protein
MATATNELRDAEPMIYGLLAEFKDAAALVEAATKARDAGYARVDAYAPFSVPGLPEAVGYRRDKVALVTLIGGILGGAGIYFLQWYSAVIDYPIISGGRPLDSWPAFLIVPYETAILSAAVVGILSWMWLCGLPKLFHPLFAADAVERSSQDCYLLVFPLREHLKARIETLLQPAVIHEVRG